MDDDAIPESAPAPEPEPAAEAKGGASSRFRRNPDEEEAPRREMLPIAGLTTILLWLTWSVVGMNVLGALQVAAGGEAVVVQLQSLSEIGLLSAYSIMFAILFVAVALAQVTVGIMWMHRAVRNAAVRLPGARWGPAWAIGAWFVPYGYLVLGWLVTRDLWNGTFEATWRRAGAPGWWLAGYLLWSIPQGVLHIINLVDGEFTIGYPTAAMPQIGPFEPAIVGIVYALLFVMAAIFFARFVQEIASDHERHRGFDVVAAQGKI